MMNLIRITYFAAAALSLLAASMVTASMLIPGRAPHSAQFWIITIGFDLFLAVTGVVLLGVGRHLPAVWALAQSVATDEGGELMRPGRRLAAYMLLGGLMLVPILLVIASAILARIDEGLALFG